MGDPTARQQADAVGRLLGKFVEPVPTPRDEVLAAIDRAYQDREGQSAELVDWLEQDGDAQGLQELIQREDLLDSGDRAPVIKLVNLLLLDAVKGRASDVHIQPYESRLVVRMRIDGVLFDALTIPKRMQEEVTSRVKAPGRMDIAEKRLPQDGRATVSLGDKTVDLRIASLPTSHGERVDRPGRLCRRPVLITMRRSGGLPTAPPPVDRISCGPWFSSRSRRSRRPRPPTPPSGRTSC